MYKRERERGSMYERGKDSSVVGGVVVVGIVMSESRAHSGVYQFQIALVWQIDNNNDENTPLHDDKVLASTIPLEIRQVHQCRRECCRHNEAQQQW
jgi:hypothetical protein